MECLYVQSTANASSTVDTASVLDFIESYGLAYFFISEVYNTTSLVKSTNLQL
jgi:hypothetical protein